MTLTAGGFPAEQVRRRAREGIAAAFPDRGEYGKVLFGAVPGAGPAPDGLDALRLVPPVFMPDRLAKLVELAREPRPDDVRLETEIGGLRSPLPLFVSAFGSTAAAGLGRGVAIARQAGRLGLPMVVGENVVPVNGYGRLGPASDDDLRSRVRAYAREVPDHTGGVAVQQSTEDADAEVWNLVYSDPAVQPLLESGRLAFELKVGQGAKPGLGGLTVLPAATADRGSRFATLTLAGDDVLRCASPGTFTEEILRQQVRLMRNNYPRARVWVKLPPGRDVGLAAATAWRAGADAVTVDGAEAGTGWAPTGFLDQVGLPLAECLRRIRPGGSCLLVSGRIWEGARAVKCIALGARAVGLGRAALLAADEDPESGLERFAACLAFELRLLVSALGRYDATDVAAEDLWPAPGNNPEPGID
ncbi:glutamate synthase-related protein [Dactylosporangium sp. CA-139114]|uniref:glutamate synthase-related protein n=1 Tax=Dactylosporangium sp. CA-139114 TaxID=3239931 RepID=UPI003D965A88